MASVSRENIGLLNDKITVKVEQTDYLPSFEKTLKNYSKQANVPGFRKGMVPVGMVKKMYGQSVFTEEVIRSIEKELSDYMVNEKLEIFAQPLPLAENDLNNMDFNNPAPYTFAFEVGLKPAVNVADLANAPIKRYIVEFPAKMVDEEIERMQTKHGKMTNPDTVSNDENVLNVVFTECDAEGNEIEGGITKDNSLLVKYFAEDFRKDLVGKKNEDFVILQAGNAFADTEKEWILKDLGLDKVENANDKFFRMLITKIGLVEKAEMNEEFFAAAYPKEIKSEVELRDALNEDIKKYWESQARNQVYDQLYHYLIDNTKIDFPEAFLKRWMETGVEKKKTKEEVNAEYPSFANSLKWTLIAEQLVKEYNIVVNPEEIREAAKNQLRSYFGNMSMGALDMEQQWVIDYVEKMVKDKKFVEETFHRIQTDKLLQAAEQKINAVDTPIAQEDFIKMQEAHHHHH